MPIDGGERLSVADKVVVEGGLVVGVDGIDRFLKGFRIEPSRFASGRDAVSMVVAYRCIIAFRPSRGGKHAVSPPG